MNKFYDLRMRADRKTAELSIFGEIGEAAWGASVTATQFTQDLRALGSVQTIYVRVNSPGGNVFDAETIYESLRRNPARVEVTIDGAALSAATIVCCAGDHVSMADHAMYMIHDPWLLAMGNATDFRETADLLDRVKEKLINIYARQSGAKRERISEMMADTTWMEPPDALSEGFVHEVTSTPAVMASYDPTKFNYRNVPHRWLERMRDRAATPLADMRRARMSEYIQRAAKLAA